MNSHHKDNRFAKVCGFIAALLTLQGALAQTAITMRARADVPSGQPVLLEAIATLKGDNAESLGQIVIRKSEDLNPAKATHIDVDDVRKTLSATDGFDWGQVTIRGATCEIRTPDIEKVESQKTSEEPKPADPPMLIAAQIPSGDIRGSIAATLAAYLNVDPQDLRLGFQPGDNELLDTPIGRYTPEIRPIGVGERVTVRLALIDAHSAEISLQGMIRAHVQVRTEVVTAIQHIRRGAVIEEQDIIVQRDWIVPNIKAASKAQVVGSSAIRTIEQGKIIGPTHVREPLAVRRGDLVTIRCVSGSVILRSQGRSTDNAKRGETIEFESLHPIRKQRRLFVAKITGPGEAMIVKEGHAGNLAQHEQE